MHLQTLLNLHLLFVQFSKMRNLIEQYLHIAKIEGYFSKNVKQIVKSRTWGGNGGSLFDDGEYDGVRQIILTRNVGIVSIQVCYEQKGQHVWGSKNGGTEAFKSDKVFMLCERNIADLLTSS